MPGSPLRLRTWALWSLLTAACAPPQAPTKPAPGVTSPPRVARPAELAEEPEPTPLALRTGRIQPLDHAEPLQLTVRRHSIDGDEQLLELALPDYAAEVPGDRFWRGTEARINSSTAPFQLIGRGGSGEMVLWLRRPRAELKAELMGDA